MDQLRQIAPAQAVRGNRHFQSPWPNDQRLPLCLDLAIEGRRILVTHGHLSLWNNILEKFLLFVPNHQSWANRLMMRRLPRAFPGADVYVFGHSHKALVEKRDGVLFVNPGAVCPTPGEIPSVARLAVRRDGIEVEVVSLGRCWGDGC
jgi:putative phosphoesterase